MISAFLDLQYQLAQLCFLVSAGLVIAGIIVYIQE